MPIVTLQRSLREIGRIRAGQKNDKGHPTKLDRFRFTSNDQHVIQAAAELYGGNPARWNGAPIGEQWEVVTDATHIEVIIPPGPAAFSQWYEQWTGGGCTHRCDGVTEVIADQPCVCDPDNRACEATTRLSVVLADLPGLGVWRLESHGYYAATELAGTVDLCQQAAGRGQFLPAVLGLQPRQVKRQVNGRPQTFNFVVPTLDVRVTPGALASGGTGSWQAIAAAPDDTPALQPGEVAAALENPVHPPARRSNTPPEIPSTGVKPRPAATQTVEVHEVRKEAVANGDDPNLAMLEVRYMTKAKALTEARRLAKTKGIDQPQTFEQIPAELAQELLQDGG